MNLKDISFATPKENILFDEVLLSLAEQGKMGQTLRFWECERPFIVLGKISNPKQDIKLQNAVRKNIPILRRCSGGGTVLQGKGCFNFTLIASKKNNPNLLKLHQSYRFICARVVAALKSQGVDPVFKPISDIALKGSEKKFSGNAQKRARQFIMHHGTVLYNFNISQIEEFLKMPQETPAYRGGRSHADFLENINIDLRDFKKALCQQFGVNQRSEVISNEEQSTLNDFLKRKDVEVDMGRL